MSNYFYYAIGVISTASNVGAQLAFAREVTRASALISVVSALVISMIVGAYTTRKDGAK